MIAMPKRADGASLAEIVEEAGWQSHAVCGALAGALKKRAGLEVVSEQSQTFGRQ
jgi:Protein of unknown function (DUF3489)